MTALLTFILRLGYFGPLVMGALDSSFLFLPFGNDLVVVALVAQHRHGVAWYVLSAAIGSTIGALLLSIVARKLGEEGICKIAGKKRYDKLNKRVGTRSGLAIAVGGIAPPPFPFTMVIAAAAALKYPLWRILLINFLSRGARFALLAWLALEYGKQVIRIGKTPAFKWSMVGFVVVCLVVSGFSIWHWMRKPRKS